MRNLPADLRPDAKHNTRSDIPGCVELSGGFLAFIHNWHTLKGVPDVTAQLFPPMPKPKE